MKLKIVFAVIFFSAVAVGCSSGESKDEKTDTANMLNDTFPATHNPPVAIPLDSNAPDATYVDPLNNMSR